MNKYKCNINNAKAAKIMSIYGFWVFIMTIILIMLKGIGMFESSWLWVLSPIWIGAFVATIIFAVLWICGALSIELKD